LGVERRLTATDLGLPNAADRLYAAMDELKTLRQKLAAAETSLLQSEKLAAMGRVAAGIAHELNNPLGVVLMYAHLLLDECDPRSPERDDAAVIAEQADRCKKIVAGLLHFARQDEVCRTPTNIDDLIDRTMRTVKTPDGIAVRIEHAAADPIAAVDADQIVQVLTNLANNAIAAMEKKGGPLTIRTTDNNDGLHIAVADAGVGIAAENLKRIFDPFFTTKPMDKGIGLGLAVSYGIIKMHSGDIRVESRADPTLGPTGTTFTVTLPRNLTSPRK